MAVLQQNKGEPPQSGQGKPQPCNQCRERKTGLWTVDPNGKPICADCARKMGRPID